MKKKTGSCSWHLKSYEDHWLSKDKNKNIFLYHLVQVDMDEELTRCYCLLDDQVENDMGIVAAMH